MATKDFKIRHSLTVAENATIEGNLTLGGNTVSRLIDSDEVQTIINSSTVSSILTDSDNTETIYGVLSGPVSFRAKNDTGSTIFPGTAVYISGISGNTPLVKKANASSAATMPAFGITSDIANNGAEVQIITFGTLTPVPTDQFTIGKTVYISADSDGALTNIKPTGASELIQNIGIVTRVHATDGSIKVGGAGRTNDIDNATRAKLDSDSAAIQNHSGRIATLEARADSDELQLQTINTRIDNLSTGGIEVFTVTLDSDVGSIGSPSMGDVAFVPYRNVSGRGIQDTSVTIAGGILYAGGTYQFSGNATNKGDLEVGDVMIAQTNTAAGDQAWVVTGLGNNADEIIVAALDSDQILEVWVNDLRTNHTTVPITPSVSGSNDPMRSSPAPKFYSGWTSVSNVPGSNPAVTTGVTLSGSSGGITHYMPKAYIHDSDGFDIELIVEGTDAYPEHKVMRRKDVFDSDQIVAIINENVVSGSVDSDVAAIAALRRDADSDSLRIQAIATEIEQLNVLVDSDLKAIADLRNDLDSESIQIRALRRDLDSDSTKLQALEETVAGLSTTDSDFIVNVFNDNLSALSITRYDYTAIQSQTVFSGADDNGNSLSYIQDKIQVFLNGILLVSTDDYTATNGTSITLTVAADSDDKLSIIKYLGASSNLSVTRYTYRVAPTGSHPVYDSEFTGVDENGNTLSYVVGKIQVYSNGILLEDSDDYIATDGSTLTLRSAPDSDDIITVFKYLGTTQSGFDSEQVVAIVNENSSGVTTGKAIAMAIVFGG